MQKKSKSTRNFVRMIREGKKNTQVWQAWVDGEEVITQWGALDGKIQETIDIPGPKGKAGTKAYVNAKQSARDQVIRDISLKAKRGYKLENEVTGEIKEKLKEALSEVTSSDSITFDGPLPHNIAFSKPVNSIPIERILKNEMEHAETIGGPFYDWTVKINGMCHLVTKDKHSKVWIQQRGKLRIENEKYPHLIEEFQALLPPKTIMLCEFFVGKGYSIEDFTNMQSIANSLPDRAKTMQKKLCLVKAYVYRIPAWKGAIGEDTTLTTIWLDFIEALIDGWDDPTMPYGQQLGFADLNFIKGIFRFEGTYKEAMEELKCKGYEGWVIYRRDRPLGNKCISFLGQPDRPTVCWKVKPKNEDDFIGIWNPDGPGEHCTTKCRIPDKKAWIDQKNRCVVCGKKLKPSGTYGTGKNKDRVGSISLYQCGADGVKRYVCEVSSGLKDKEKQQMADEGLFVGVLQVGFQDRKYVTREQDSNALTHPKVLHIREDKELDECKNEEV